MSQALITTCKFSIKNYNGYNDKLLNKLYQYYLEEKFVDVTFICSKKTLIKTHSLMLSTMSSFFDDIFKLKQNRELYCLLPDISEELLRKFLEFLYKGNVTVTEDSLPEFFKLIQYFNIEGVDKTEFLDKNESTTEFLDKYESTSSINDNSEENIKHERIWQPPLPTPAILEASLSEDNDSQLNTTLTSIKKCRELSIPLVDIQRAGLNNSQDETLCEDAPIIIEQSDPPSSPDTELIDDVIERINTKSSHQSSSQINDCVTPLNKTTDCLSSDSVQIIEKDITLVYIQDDEKSESNVEDSALKTKRGIETKSEIPEKMIKYKIRGCTRIMADLDSSLPLESENSSDELICTSKNLSIETDELLKKSMELLKDK